MTDPNVSASPVHGAFDINGQTVDDPRNGIIQGGLTKREHFAAMAMQGILSDHTFIQPNQHDDVANYAIQCADALIKALNKEEQ